MSSPFFSIIIPLYNKEKHIKDTLMSALNQTFSHFEIIVVNDGSTDESLNAVESIADDRIKVFTIENQGVSHARNYGISRANSDLIVFLDADDLWKPFHLEHLKTLFDKFPNCGLYATAYTNKVHGRELTSVYKNIPEENDWIGVVDDFFLSSTVNCIAWTSAVMIPKYVFNVVGNFDESITLGAGEDTDLWVRIALKFPVAFCNSVSAVYNLQADNRISNSHTNLRTFLNLYAYNEQAKTNKSLQNFLDINRFSIAIQYKLVGNEEKAKAYINNIHKDNLNAKQRFLLKMSTGNLKRFLKIKNVLRKTGIELSAFR